MDEITQPYSGRVTGHVGLLKSHPILHR